uniref:KAP NTPase domain-containing protein n=1 Tax=Eptatretus burgeri TaxID=7764 RepID=A0A8C4QI68_EPTBU
MGQTRGILAPGLDDDTKEKNTDKEGEKNTDKEDSPCITKKLDILCNPLEKTRKMRVRFIFVSFNAWEFSATSDRLWAGMMTTLCAEVRSHFGPIPTSIYRALRKTIVPSQTPKDDCLFKWEPIKYLCIPAWIATIVITVLAITFIIVLLFFSFTIDFAGYISSALLGLGGSIAGASTLIVIKYIIVVAYNFILTQKSRIEKEMNNKDISTQLGFVHLVKEEVEFINNFIRFMEFFEQCKLRLVFIIQDLDRCPHEKITRVLEAMNIMLSVKKSRFISLLAADPTLIIRSFEYASRKNGYEILNRTVDLSFSIAEMGDNANQNAPKGPLTKTEEENVAARQVINRAFNILKSFDQKSSNIDHRPRTKRRIKNAVLLIIRLLFSKYGHLPNELTPEKIVAWTVLSTQWPCRLSWVLQCEEDIKEGIRKPSNDSDGNRFLWDTYTESLEELRVLMNGIDDLFILDGDPNVFARHLNRDYRFTTSDMEILHPVNVNLDHSIQRRMKHLREKHYIRNYQLHPDSDKQEPLSSLRALHVFSLTSEEICSEV